mmetsp:Transcript_2418/g.6932  ORF Transcript_2418/g.6932 Transcript_2418/m.6932 type:complete len:139 (+) Transcript_2418:738-1154(+)
MGRRECTSTAGPIPIGGSDAFRPAGELVAPPQWVPFHDLTWHGLREVEMCATAALNASTVFAKMWYSEAPNHYEQKMRQMRRRRRNRYVCSRHTEHYLMRLLLSMAREATKFPEEQDKGWTHIHMKAPRKAAGLLSQP